MRFPFKPVVLVITFLLLLAAGTPGFAQNTQETQASNDRRGETALDRYLRYEKESYARSFYLTPYRQNYIMPGTYNSSPNNKPFEGTKEEFHNAELKFQISFKYPLTRKIFKDNKNFFFTYTQRSFWQVYDFGNSSPFRETNYEPELIYRHLYDNKEHKDNNFLGLKKRVFIFGLWNHQSNGKSGTTSRSWHRTYASFIFEKALKKNDFYLEIKPWIRWPENDEDDDNPNIEKFIGYGEITATYHIHNHTKNHTEDCAEEHTKDHIFSLMLRNNFRAHNRGSVQLDWSFPFYGNLRGYVQWFNGYGESLIDYNHAVNRVGIGLILFDWL